MKVFNLFGEPGVGKSVNTMKTAAELRLQGYDIEYVHEFAKEVVQDNHYRLLNHQNYLFAQQTDSLLRHMNYGTKAVITDSPILLSLIYLNENTPKSFIPFVIDVFNSFDNNNFLLERTFSYVYKHRKENEVQAKSKRECLIKMLDDCNINYKVIQSNKESYIHLMEEIKLNLDII